MIVGLISVTVINFYVALHLLNTISFKIAFTSKCDFFFAKVLLHFLVSCYTAIIPSFFFFLLCNNAVNYFFRMIGASAAVAVRQETQVSFKLNAFFYLFFFYIN
jgi:hypothetical protein